MNFAMKSGIKSLLTLSLVAGIAGCDSPAASPPPEPPSLNAAVHFDGEEFTVRNSDGFAWKNCTFNINLKVFDSGYEASAKEISAGGSATLPARGFANSDGERFNSETHVVKTFVVDCDTPAGKAIWTGEFNAR
jgi:hypothetical protein